MKRLLFLLAFVIFLTDQSNSQTFPNSWQQLSSPSAQQVKDHFENPPSHFSNSVTSGWDGITKEGIVRDLDCLHRLGFGVATIEAGYGMPAEYLSDGWFQMVKTAVQEATKRGMHVWIIDEGKYPSRFAGGKLSKERPDLRMQCLVVYEHINAAARQTITRKISASVASGSPILGVTFKDCNLTAEKDLVIEHARNVDLSGLKIDVKEGKAVTKQDVQETR